MDEFESAVDAVVDGDVETLRRLLRANPELIGARSTREHHATLLHYVGANGVEDERQRTPPNAVETARVLLDAGADVNAMADMYGGSDVIGLVATSCHPEAAGVQDALMELLLGRGAVIGPRLLRDCLANGRGRAAEFLARRAASLDIEGAAGVGRLDVVEATVSAATEEQKRDAFAWACEFGRTEVVLFLLDHGMPIDARLRHHGQTGLHWAAVGGHLDTVNALLARHAPLDIRDKEFGGTPLDWALYGGHEEVAEALRRHHA
jgi:ankyrin repeat protein